MAGAGTWLGFGFVAAARIGDGADAEALSGALAWSGTRAGCMDGSMDKAAIGAAADARARGYTGVWVGVRGGAGARAGGGGVAGAMADGDPEALAAGRP